MILRLSTINVVDHADCSQEGTNIMFINTLGPRQNGRHFPDDILKWIFFNENVWVSIEISLKFVPKGDINNILALVQMMAWRRPGNKPLSEPVMVSLLTHTWVTLPQWVKVTRNLINNFIKFEIEGKSFPAPVCEPCSVCCHYFWRKLTLFKPNHSVFEPINLGFSHAWDFIVRYLNQAM